MDDTSLSFPGSALRPPDGRKIEVISNAKRLAIIKRHPS